MQRGTGDEWDRDGTWDPFVLYEDGVCKMWYGGGNAHCDWGYAGSADGVHFMKKGQFSHLGKVEDDHVCHDKALGRYFMSYWDRAHNCRESLLARAAAAAAMALPGRSRIIAAEADRPMAKMKLPIPKGPTHA